MPILIFLNTHLGICRMTKLTKINLDVNNRMLRLGLGKHEGKWFFRVDLWFFGFRITGDA